MAEKVNIDEYLADYPLEGTGKNIRHMNIRTESDLEEDFLTEIIKKSVEIDQNEG